jgi:1-acyl-sn-glycerol-3-phosphate acyltransferase
VGSTGRKFSIGYFILELPVKFGLSVFYRHYDTIGLENFPPIDKPTIIIANHQNGMMDPFMVCAFAPRQLHWLTRADVFKSPLAYKFLTHINMLPIYRERDKVADIGEKNEAIFQECYSRIAAGNTVCLFPEGNHNHVKHLRTLKKGAARLAFGTLETKGRDLDVQIVPVGVEYSAFNLFRSSLLLNFGKPIHIQDYLDRYDKNPALGITSCVKDMHTRLSESIVDIKSSKLVDLCENSRFMANADMLSMLGLKDSLKNNFVAHQSMVNKLLAIEDLHGDNLALLGEKSVQFKQLLEEQDIRLEVHETAARNLGKKPLYSLGLILLFPLALIGFILNGLPAYLIHEFVKKKVKDIHFKSSIMFFLGIFTIPIFWIFEYLTISLVLSNWTLSLFLFPVALTTAIAAIRFWETWKLVQAIKWIKRGFNKKDDSALRANEIRQEIVSTYSELIK